MINSAITTAFVMIGVIMGLDLGITAGGILSGEFVEVNPVYVAGPAPSPYANQFVIIIALALSKIISSVLIVSGIESIKFVGG